MSALEAWAAAHPPTYATGERVEPRDVVDFGLDPRTLGVDPVEAWYGNVVRVEGAHVIVDTFLNSLARFEPGELRLVQRG